jgi:hypothetical protein
MCYQVQENVVASLEMEAFDMTKFCPLMLINFNQNLKNLILLYFQHFPASALKVPIPTSITRTRNISLIQSGNTN